MALVCDPIRVRFLDLSMALVCDPIRVLFRLISTCHGSRLRSHESTVALGVALALVFDPIRVLFLLCR